MSMIVEFFKNHCSFKILEKVSLRNSYFSGSLLASASNFHLALLQPAFQSLQPLPVLGTHLNCSTFPSGFMLQNWPGFSLKPGSWHWLILGHCLLVTTNATAGMVKAVAVLMGPVVVLRPAQIQQQSWDVIIGKLGFSYLSWWFKPEPAWLSHINFSSYMVIG